LQVAKKILFVLFVIGLFVYGLAAPSAAQPPNTLQIAPEDEETEEVPPVIAPANIDQSPQPVQQPASGSVSQQPQQPPEAKPVTGAEPTTHAKPAAPKPLKSGDVSFNFDDADVFSVIQTIFGDVLKVNYIIDPQVKGRVNFRSVAPIPKEKVLSLMEVILRLNGIAVVEDAGLYRIIPIADVSKEPAPVAMGRDPEKVAAAGMAVFQVVPVRHVTSTDMTKALSPFLSRNAQIIDVPKSNYIIIVDTASNVKRLLELINIFDSEQLREIRPQVYVYPVQNSKAKDVANILQQIFTGGKQATSVTSRASVSKTAPGAAQAQPISNPQSQFVPGPENGEAFISDMTKIFPDEIANTIIVLATPEDYRLIAETIQMIDILPRQVVIEGLIAQITLNDNLSFGLSWSLKTDVNFSLKPFTRDFDLSGEAGQNAPAPDATGLSSRGFSFVATDAAGIVRARLEALASESRAKVLAAPHILVSDNREARIQVGQQVPLVTSETNVTGTTNIQRTIQYRDIGIILKVKPQVNDSGLISLEISQEVSSLAAVPVDLGDGTTSPTLNKTEATTSLVAQDGQTIIIGGLIRNDTTDGKTGIPFLSKIPYLGWLFGSTTKVDQRTELVILLTPRVIRTQTEASDVTSDYINKYKGIGGDIKLKQDGDKPK